MNNILHLFDRSTNDFSKTKPDQIYEIRKAFARVLLSKDYELVKEAKTIIEWANNNQWLFEISPTSKKD
jgi:uncharacterized protein with PIN domain